MAETSPPPPRADEQARAGEIIARGHTFGTITDKISSIVQAQRTPRRWWIGFGIGFVLTMVLFAAIGNLALSGIGIWGINSPVFWGFDIVNFVWWIGIGHAGTL